MFVDRFFQKFAGEDTLSLLRCMAVASGSLSLDGTTISEIEAKRFIVSYQQPDTKPFDQWPDLTKEIHDRIEGCDGTPKNQKAINAFFHCITSSIDKAHLLLEGLGFGDRANLGDYNHKWKEVCDEFGFTWVKINQYGNSAYEEKLGNLVWGDDGQQHAIDNAGVAGHPSDKGMKAMADELFKKLSFVNNQ